MLACQRLKTKRGTLLCLTGFLDYDNNKFSFTKEFIKSLVPNTPTIIEDRIKNDLVQVIKNVQKNCVKTITPTKIDGVLKFQATLGNGAKEM
eukprot:8021678-Ditylum_brightwellii.AAC.1